MIGVLLFLLTSSVGVKERFPTDPDCMNKCAGTPSEAEYNAWKKCDKLYPDDLDKQEPCIFKLINEREEWCKKRCA